MAKAKKEKKVEAPTLKILKVTVYKGFYIMIQHMVRGNVFQCVLFKEDQFYQAHNIPPVDQIETPEDELKFGMLMLDTAFSIADAIESAPKEMKEKLLDDKNKKEASVN